jgi:hypothetical protein
MRLQHAVGGRWDLDKSVRWIVGKTLIGCNVDVCCLGLWRRVFDGCTDRFGNTTTWSYLRGREVIFFWGCKGINKLPALRAGLLNEE